MSLPRDWRELLRMIIADPAERERIATEIEVHPGTLTRWVNGETSPRPHNLRQLYHALPRQQRSQFAHLWPENVSEDEEQTAQEIPYSFILSVLEARANTTDQLRSWIIRRSVLQQALKHLDPDCAGMAITVVRCMPQREDGKVHSLREFEGLGTPPWGGDLEDKALLLGAESLAGHVTVSCRMEQIGDLRAKRTLLPAYQVEYEVSAAACPIMYGSRIAGCLLLSCTQAHYFASEARQALIRGYTHLLSLAFEPEEFYEPSRIELHIMPPQHVQQSYFTGFRQRVLELIKESTQGGGRLASPLAEQLVWREIEDAMLNYRPPM
jgi:transcriptional regulator with XRE-family HTH domain